MKFGVVFPQTEIGADPLAVRDFAQSAEELGFRYLLAYDHVLGANPDRPAWQDGRRRPYSYESMFHEVFVLFGYLAGQTQEIELVTGILIAPQRQTALIAKQAAEADILSGGRLRLGIGIGWNEVEYEGLGVDFHKRGKRIEEQVAMLRALWTNRLVTFEGESEFINDAGIYPLPIQQPIPIWMGGAADIVLRRMARMADGWFMPGFDLERSKILVGQLRQYLENEGRNFRDFGLEQRLHLERVPETEWESWIQHRAEMGVSEVGIYPVGETTQDLIESLRTFAPHITG